MAATDYDFASTRTQILERAFRELGVLSPGDRMSAEQEAQGVQALNALVKSWQARRTFLWTMQTFTQSLTGSVGTYNLPTGTPFACVDSGWIRDSNNVDTPIQRINFSEFQSITQKTLTGVPSHFYADTSTVSIWPIPLDSTYTFVGSGIVRLKDWDAPGGTGEFPPHWENALTFGVAYDLSPEYFIPTGERTDLGARAERAFTIARNGISGDTQDNCRIKGCY